MMRPLGLLFAVLVGGAASACAQSTVGSATVTVLLAPPGDLNGGGRMSNAGGTVIVDASIGDPASGVVSNVTVGGVRTKGNFVGQLYDVTSVTVAASPTTVGEGATRQLGASALLDDATTLDLAATEVAWNVVNGPLAGIDSNGLATAALVYVNTAATVRGTYQAIDGDLGLTVLDTNLDNFGTYASDGIDDMWQVGYFGPPPNANAMATADPDGDGSTNDGEFLFGFSPVDPASVFRLSIVGFSAATTVDLRMNKAIPGRTYQLKSSPDLTTPFAPLGAPFSVPGEETDKLVQDAAATGTRKFYEIEVSKP